MARLTRTLFNQAMEAGVSAFIDTVNDALSAADIKTPEQQALIPHTADGPMQKLIAFYVEGIKKKYGPKARPNLDGKSQGVLKRMLKTYNPGQVAKLIQTYLEMDDKWFYAMGYNLVTLEAQLQKVLIKATTGQDIGGKRGTDEALAERQGKEPAKEINSEETKADG